MLINFCINHKNFENWQIPNLFETNPFCFAAATPRAVGAAVQTAGQEPRGGTSQRGAAGPGAVPTSATLKLWVFNKKKYFSALPEQNQGGFPGGSCVSCSSTAGTCRSLPTCTARPPRTAHQPGAPAGSALSFHLRVGLQGVGARWGGEGRGRVAGL